MPVSLAGGGALPVVASSIMASSSMVANSVGLYLAGNCEINMMMTVLPCTVLRLAVWCSGNALVSINAVALHRARLVLGWVTAFGQVNCLIT